LAEIKPFSGYRYRLQNIDDLGRFIAPPYDMLDDAKIEALYKKDPANVVRIDQNRREATDADNRTRHDRAAKLFADWRAKKVLCADEQPSLYIYEQQFTAERAGKTERFERTGIITLVKLTDFAEGVVLPHEYTLSGPKIDRYEHLDATHLNVGQIFGLLSDDTGSLYSLIKTMKQNAERAGCALDADGVRHTLYRCGDKAFIERFTNEVRPSTILIADGHHRYETALKFYRDHRNAPAYDSVMMTLVSMADPGLLIRSFHRVIRKPQGEAGTVADFRAALANSFAVVDLGDADISKVNSFLAGGNVGEMLFVDAATRHAYGLTLSREGERYLQETMPERSMPWKRLDMSKINLIGIGRILGLPLDGHVLHDVIAYMNDPVAALDAALDAKANYGAFFIRPVAISSIHEVVKAGERMPQKSTNFYPKLYSGLVFNGMDAA
jgi:uncharacterized protein (DUF1015 family)